MVLSGILKSFLESRHYLFFGLLTSCILLTIGVFKDRFVVLEPQLIIFWTNDTINSTATSTVRIIADPVGSKCFQHFVPGENKKVFQWYLDGAGESRFISDYAPNISNYLWPKDVPGSDRIQSQLLYHPEPKVDKTERNKLILIAGNRGPFRSRFQTSQRYFLTSKCPFCSCQLTYNFSLAGEVDAILFIDRIMSYFVEEFKRPAHQIWIFSSSEASSPIQGNIAAFRQINWTSTYRYDSEISTPYSKFVLFDPTSLFLRQTVNFAKKKSGKGQVAWFVSNCYSRNDRMEYAQELSKYISVDIFGACTGRKCGSCAEMLQRDYKFYLSFENRNCRWYVTEKLWTALNSETIPIVMGAPRMDYEIIAPYKSFIHVDDFSSPRDLATYLHYLDQNHTAFNEFFQWKGTGTVIDNKSHCRICALLNSDPPERTYPNFEEWWEGACLLKTTLHWANISNH